MSASQIILVSLVTAYAAALIAYAIRHWPL